MAKPYPTLPLSVLDELNSLNAALDAYHHLTEAWIEQAFRDGCQGDSALFIAGLEQLFRPVIEGYQDIASQVDQFRKLGTVSVLSIPDEEKP